MQPLKSTDAAIAQENLAINPQNQAVADPRVQAVAERSIPVVSGDSGVKGKVLVNSALSNLLVEIEKLPSFLVDCINAVEESIDPALCSGEASSLPAFSKQETDNLLDKKKELFDQAACLQKSIASASSKDLEKASKECKNLKSRLEQLKAEYLNLQDLYIDTYKEVKNVINQVGPISPEVLKSVLSLVKDYRDTIYAQIPRTPEDKKMSSVQIILIAVLFGSKNNTGYNSSQGRFLMLRLSGHALKLNGFPLDTGVLSDDNCKAIVREFEAYVSGVLSKIPGPYSDEYVYSHEFTEEKIQSVHFFALLNFLIAKSCFPRAS